jgi:hypothetical protein
MGLAVARPSMNQCAEVVERAAGHRPAVRELWRVVGAVEALDGGGAVGVEGGGGPVDDGEVDQWQPWESGQEGLFVFEADGFARGAVDIDGRDVSVFEGDPEFELVAREDSDVVDQRGAVTGAAFLEDDGEVGLGGGEELADDQSIWIYVADDLDSVFRNDVASTDENGERCDAFAATVLVRVLAIGEPVLRADPEARDCLGQPAVVLQERDLCAVWNCVTIREGAIHRADVVAGASLSR